MKKITVYANTRIVGSKVKTTIEVPPDSSDDEIEEYAREALWELIEWGFYEEEGGAA